MQRKAQERLYINKLSGNEEDSRDKVVNMLLNIIERSYLMKDSKEHGKHL